MDYAINVKSIDKVLYAHIHEGKGSVNGPIVVTLLIHQVLLVKWMDN